MAAVNDPDLSRALWRKSSFSGNGNNCVEVAAANGHVAVRDTTNRTGVTGIFDARTWRRFTSRIKRGEIRLRLPGWCSGRRSLSSLWTGRRGRRVTG
jgi:hypothetical protein